MQQNRNLDCLLATLKIGGYKSGALMILRLNRALITFK
jgi:hypothetical protein